MCLIIKNICGLWNSNRGFICMYRIKIEEIYKGIKMIVNSFGEYRLEVRILGLVFWGVFLGFFDFVYIID